ncbi:MULTISPECIES: hypothetical protein [unclassified Spirosoma]|uniref:hypothetical protein n=1 Tax=unclassified Spirosoma TaxID=2621999 RepID=UPI0009674EFA|nr:MULTISPECIES: hypothetical protein [unclassified Spirosoma]MBN8825863.1 hypothetical protein [Spirosoma sp.]OJW70557.1 MAG: hypothetical protein BGO59_25340 [Spirosoma sp. 48-14]
MIYRRLQTTSWVVLLLLLSLAVQAQRPSSARRQRRLQAIEADTLTDTRRGPYTVVVTAGGGLSYYSTHLGVPAAIEQTRLSRFGTPSSLRVMWYPDHRLRVGLETGWTTMYSYRGQVAGENTHVYVSAVPILVVFSMPLGWLTGTDRSIARRMAITAGTGLYVNHSRLDYLGTVMTNTNSLGWMAAASYTYPIGRRFRIAGELKWFDAVAVENAAFTAELQLVWRAFSW